MYSNKTILLLLDYRRHCFCTCSLSWQLPAWQSRKGEGEREGEGEQMKCWCSVRPQPVRTNVCDYHTLQASLGWCQSRAPLCQILCGKPVNEGTNASLVLLDTGFL